MLRFRSSCHISSSPFLNVSWIEAPFFCVTKHPDWRHTDTNRKYYEKKSTSLHVIYDSQ